MSGVRYLPHPRVEVKEWDMDGYPAAVLVKMGDSECTLMEFVRKVEQPHPNCKKAIDLIRVMSELTYGGYKAKHEKK